MFRRKLPLLVEGVSGKLLNDQVLAASRDGLYQAYDLRGNLRRVFRFPIDNLRSLIKWRRVEEAATWSTFEGDLLERHFSFENLIEHFEPT